MRFLRACSMETLKDNIVLLCKFYQPKEKYVGKKRDLSKQRDFVSCNSSYNYVSYVDTGATNKVPKDYEMYVGNKEKSCGAFSKNGLLTDKEKRELREMLRTTQSNIWDMVISFREDFGNAYCRDYDQAYEFCKSELPKFFKRAGLDPDNVVWYAGLHENTENKHIHISFFEKEPTHYANGGKLTYHSGTINKKILLESKFFFERKLTNASAEIVKARKDLYEKYNLNFSNFDLCKKGKKLLLELYKELPKSGRLGYDSENMLPFKKKIDDTTEWFLVHNEQTWKSYLNYNEKLAELQTWKKQRYAEEGIHYKEDMFRRLGNKTIQTALELGKQHDEIEKMKTYGRKQKAYKKQMRKFEWDRLLNMLEYYSFVEQQEMEAFTRWHEKIEHYAKQQAYLNGYDEEM